MSLTLHERLSREKALLKSRITSAMIALYNVRADRAGKPRIKLALNPRAFRCEPPFAFMPFEHRKRLRKEAEAVIDALF